MENFMGGEPGWHYWAVTYYRWLGSECPAGLVTFFRPEEDANDCAKVL